MGNSVFTNVANDGKSGTGRWNKAILVPLVPLKAQKTKENRYKLEHRNNYFYIVQKNQYFYIYKESCARIYARVRKF